MTERIQRALQGITRAPASEIELHGQIAACLDAAGIPYEREVSTATGPVDFVVDETIALEVKVKGSAISVSRQVIRYLQDDRFSGAVVVTTKPLAMPLESVPVESGGWKQIHVIELWRNFF